MQTLNLAFSVACRARSAPTSTALVVDEQQVSYRRLAFEAGRVAAWLRARLATRAPRVGILAARSLETYAGLLGTAWAGGTYIPINPRWPTRRLEAVLARARLDALLVDRRGLVHLEDWRPEIAGPVLSVAPAPVAGLSADQHASWGALPPPPHDCLPVPVPRDHPAYVIFTSGTTGVPKGVVVTVGNVAHFLACVRSFYPLGPSDRFGQFCETAFDVSVFEMFACWESGASLHVVPETKLVSPAGFIRQHELTVWASVPSVITMMGQIGHLAPGTLPSLRVSFLAGEGFPVAAARAWLAAAPHSVVDNHYGPTETTVDCTRLRVEEPLVETPDRGILSIGVPYPGTLADIVSPSGVVLGTNEVGELALAGPQVASGYLDDEPQTARRFVMREGSDGRVSRWYLSGDRAYRDEHGRLHHLGRVDHQVKVLGNRVELEEVEAHLRVVCETDAVAALAWPMLEGSAVGLVAFVCGSRLAPGAVREALRQRVPGYMVPGRVLPLSTWPLATTGKVDRQHLRRLLDQSTPA